MIARWINETILWFQTRVLGPVMEVIVSRVEEEHSRTRARMESFVEIEFKRLTGRLLAEVATVRVEVELLRAALADAEQMKAFAAKIESVDERLHHLTAQMFGKSVAEKIQQSRGPRVFTHEDRQWHE